MGHSLQNNDWITKIDAQFIILDKPKSEFTIEELGNILTSLQKAVKNDNEYENKGFNVF